MNVLDVSSGRGTQSIYYAKTYGVNVTGLDISQEMIDTATQRALEQGIEKQVTFIQGDSQNLPFDDCSFDVVINECAVGYPIILKKYWMKCYVWSKKRFCCHS